MPGSLDKLFEDLTEDAQDLGNAGPSADLIQEAQRVLSVLYDRWAKAYPLYMMPDGAIAIDIRGTPPDGILIRLKQDGSAHCSGETRGQTWRKLYPRSSELPDATLIEEIDRLGPAVSE
jgi:hypothetical protein